MAFGWIFLLDSRTQKNKHSFLTPADLQSFWLLDKFGREALNNFKLHLKSKEKIKIYSEVVCPKIWYR
jgi:hypothetical protein